MKIVTPVVNNPDFIQIQYYTLKKYFQGEFDFIVFNDGKDFRDFTNDGNTNIRQEIKDKCQELGIKCVNIPNDHHISYIASSGRCADSMNFILNYQKQNPDKYLMLDSDMFLIDYLDPNEFNSYDSALVLQERDGVYYFWHGLCYLDFTKIKNIDMMNWNTCESPRLDTGGMMYKWLKIELENKIIPSITDLRRGEYKHADKTYFIRHLWSCTWNLDELPNNLKHNQKLIEVLCEDRRNENGQFFCEIYDSRFLHYRAGCNWRAEGMNFHKVLTKKLKEALIDYN
jgi:hypothetical protein